MNRSRVIGLLLFVILLGCVAVIALDQLGMFGGPQTVSAPASNPATPNPLPGTPSTGDGYGDLK
ncbi:hypothetical protein [Deinococcus koreensis]|uniref:Uncharacterized protein n=1 Tax=Deinococcus koreensis TaxID=2054903 RepID=A0A2K3UYW1_9DEIO|nr:hypothetical protein [Deinococcus koreensis]PNY81718.1 hypothetical protein CVO96_10320 [Deinococcus koreensis]